MRRTPRRKRQFEIRAYRGRAAVSQRRRKWDQAAADLKKLVELDPENAEAHRQLGMVNFWLNDAKAGYAGFVTAKKLNPKLPSPYVQAGVMYDALAKSAESLKSFEAAYAENKTDETTLVAYANALVRSGDLPKADSILKQAQAAAPNSLNVWLLSGVAARMMNKPDVAEQAFSCALTLSPTNTDVLGQLAQLLIGQEDEAKKIALANVRSRTSASTKIVPTRTSRSPGCCSKPATYKTPRKPYKTASAPARSAPTPASWSPRFSWSATTKPTPATCWKTRVKNDQGIFVMREEATAMLAKLK